MSVNIQEDEREVQAAKAIGLPPQLNDLVQRFHVCWEALPEYYFVAVKDPLHGEVKERKTERRQIGFLLQLSGTHEAGVEHPQPGCQHCRKVWSALKDIADWILPKEIRDTGYDLDSYDQSIRYDPVRKFRPEVLLTIRLVHRSGFDREVDACEVRCLNEMTERLKQLGARNGKWASD
jgi:hypothetical protein